MGAVEKIRILLNLDAKDARKQAKALKADVKGIGDEAQGVGKKGGEAFGDLSGAMTKTVAVVGTVAAVVGSVAAGIDLVNAAEKSLFQGRLTRTQQQGELRESQFHVVTSATTKALGTIPGFGGALGASNFSHTLAGKFPSLNPSQIEAIAFPIAATAGSKEAAMPLILQALGFAQAAGTQGGTAGVASELLGRTFGQKTVAQRDVGLRGIFAAARESPLVTPNTLAQNLALAAPAFKGSTARELSNFIVALTGPVKAERVPRALVRLGKISGLVSRSPEAKAFVSQRLREAGFSGNEVDNRSLGMALGTYIRNAPNLTERIRRGNEIQDIVNVSPDVIDTLMAIGTPDFLELLGKAEAAEFSPAELEGKRSEAVNPVTKARAAKFGAAAPSLVPGGFGEIGSAQDLFNESVDLARGELTDQEFKQRQRRQDVGGEGMFALKDKPPSTEQFDKLLGANRFFVPLSRALRQIFKKNSRSSLQASDRRPGGVGRAERALRLREELISTHDDANSVTLGIGNVADEIDAFVAVTLKALEFVQQEIAQDKLPKVLGGTGGKMFGAREADVQGTLDAGPVHGVGLGLGGGPSVGSRGGFGTASDINQAPVSVTTNISQQTNIINGADPATVPAPNRGTGPAPEDSP